MRRLPRLLGSIVSPALTFALACGLACQSPPTPTRANIVLITVDTLRADHLGAYGYERATSPAIDSLAREGVLVESAYATAPITAPSHASLLTGRYPLSHGVLTNGLYVLGENETTLAEILAAEGYRTGAFVGAVPLDHRFGFAQGFDVFDDDLSTSVLRGSHISPWYQIPLIERERRGDEVITPAIEWLEANADAPFFLWVHLFDPHGPYSPPEPFRSEWHGGAEPAGRNDAATLTALIDDGTSHGWLRGETSLDAVRALYDGEIAFTDSQVARLLGSLDDLGHRDDTVVAFTADHGEGLGEHGEYYWHGDKVWESTLQVPLIIRAPWKLPAASIARVRARGVDLLPTLLDLLALPPAPGIDGETLLPGLLSGEPEPRPVLAQAAYRDRSGKGMFAYIEGQLKIIETAGLGAQPDVVACYDLTADPGERRLVCDEHESRVSEMVTRLEKLKHRLEIDDPDGAEMPESVLEALRSLGYTSD